jgi:hypothetical protein
VLQVVYSWSATRGGNAVTLPAAAVGSKNLRLEPVDLVSFVRAVPYVFTLTASFEGSVQQSTSSMVRHRGSTGVARHACCARCMLSQPSAMKYDCGCCACLCCTVVMPCHDVCSSEADTSPIISVQAVTLARSDLSASLKGPMGKVASTGNLTFDATGSQDPDSTTAALRYTFSCEPAPCFKDPGYMGAPGCWDILTSCRALPPTCTHRLPCSVCMSMW